MTDDSFVSAVEAELAELSGILTEPAEYECLRCYLLRMISEFGCDGTHRWTIRWRAAHAARASGPGWRLQRPGAMCCDCEVLLNVFPDYPAGGKMLPCTGQRRPGSAVPCDLGQPRGLGQLRRSA